MTEAERKELASFEARQREREELRDQTFRQLMLDAQACARSMFHSPQLNSPEEWEATDKKALEDYRSGRALMDQLGADRLIDAPTAGLLLAIRRGLIEETNATSASELVVIDMAVTSVLLSMGMMQLPPVIVSMPLKLLLFVMVDGWYLIVGSLAKSVM